MVPVHDFLKLNDAEVAEKVPYILMVDDDNALYRVIIESGLIKAARRCREMWRSIRELGGIDNSHAKKALAEAKAIWEQQKEQELAASKHEVAVAATPQPAERQADAVHIAWGARLPRAIVPDVVTPPFSSIWVAGVVPIARNNSGRSAQLQGASPTVGRR